jgi:hypothetical protein
MMIEDFSDFLRDEHLSYLENTLMYSHVWG